MYTVSFSRTCLSRLPKIIKALNLRSISSHKIDENIFLYSKLIKEDPKKSCSEYKNLVVVFPWAQSKVNHIEKYCSIYTNKGFDVLVVRNHLANILRTKKTQKIAGNVVSYIAENEQYNKLLIHGFSAGAYIWSECLVHLHDHAKFDSISKRIKGQIWDSISGPKEAAIGMSNSIFPHNRFMESVLRTSVDTSLKILYEYTTKYYLRGDKYFHEKAIVAPALIFASKIDPIGTEKNAREIANSFKKLNIDTTLKVFDDSPHVQHYQKYKEEFLKVLTDHITKCKVMI